MRPAEAAKEDADLASLRDAVHAIEAGCRRSRDVEIAVRVKRQVISGDGRLKRGKNKNFAASANLENRAAAVAHVQVFRMVERDPRGDAHAFDPLLRAAFGRDAMDGAVVAAGDEKISLAVERQPAGIHKGVDERLYAVVRGDLVQRHGNALPARPGKGDVDVAFEIHRRICDRMKIVRDLQSDVYGMRLAFVAGSGHAHRASVRAFRDARDQPALAGQRQAGFCLAEAHHRACLRPRYEAAPVDGDLAAWNGRGRRNSLNVRNAVFFCRGPETEFHNRIKCNATRSRIAA